MVECPISTLAKKKGLPRCNMECMDNIPGSTCIYKDNDELFPKKHLIVVYPNGFIAKNLQPGFAESDD